MFDFLRKQPTTDLIAAFDDADQRARNAQRELTKAARQLNELERQLSDALASNVRLCDALATKQGRLDRIAAHFSNQQSGTAKLVVKMARGEG